MQIIRLILKLKKLFANLEHSLVKASEATVEIGFLFRSK